MPPEYLEYHCCMCPQKGSSSQTCPGVPGVLHPEPTPCRFVKRYRDNDDWEYFVREGAGCQFWTFCCPPGKNARVWGRGYTNQPTFDQAQTDLNAEAKRRGWREADNP